MTHKQKLINEACRVAGAALCRVAYPLVKPALDQLFGGTMKLIRFSRLPYVKNGPGGPV